MKIEKIAVYLSIMVSIVVLFNTVPELINKLKKAENEN